MAPSTLAQQIAARVVEHLRHGAVPRGTRLAERALAEQLRVSRSPVRTALRLLAEDGVVEPAAHGGYRVLRTGAQLSGSAAAHRARDADDEPYLRIAAERLDGELPDKVTESALLRRYRLTPAQLRRILRRIHAEGWIERLPGYGWQFQPMLTSERGYRDSYRFRLLIEPAAIREPTFALDRAALEQVLDQQRRLVDGAIWSVGNAELFDLNSGFHETIMECGHNTFFADALRRTDRLRRLIEYRRSLPRERALVRCSEHVRLAELLLGGRNAEASEFMALHLSTVGREKVEGAPGSPTPPPGPTEAEERRCECGGDG